MHRRETPAALSCPHETLYEAVSAAGALFPGNIAYEYMGSATNYGEFLQRVEAAAAGFAALGIKKGDRATLCLPNCPQVVDCFYALNRLGAVANIIHPLSAPGEIAYALTLSRSAVLVALDRFSDRVSKALGQLDRTVTVVYTGAGDSLPPGKRVLCPSRPAVGLRWKQFLARGKGLRLPPAAGTAADGAVILYSGGTTGKTKGILLTNENLNMLGLQTMAAAGFAPIRGMRMLSVLPVFHGFGLGIGIHTALMGGASCILVPRPDPRRYGRLVLRKRPNILPGVPTLFEAFLGSDLKKRADLRFLQGVFCGGDALSEDLRSRVNGFLRSHGARVEIRQGYGLTECVTASCLVPPEGAPAGSVGRPFPGMEYRICKPGTAEVLPPDTVGEICISGPTVMAEYVDAEEETRQTLFTDQKGKKWLRTGDLGRMDEDGFVYVAGRIKRMIITGGYNVYPSQVESVLASHAAVAQVCVVGVADPYRVRRVKAFVVLRAGIRPSDGLRQQLLRHCGNHLAAYAVPRELAFCRQLPKTGVGKVAYRELEEHG